MSIWHHFNVNEWKKTAKDKKMYHYTCLAVGNKGHKHVTNRFVILLLFVRFVKRFYHRLNMLKMTNTHNYDTTMTLHNMYARLMCLEQSNKQKKMYFEAKSRYTTSMAYFHTAIAYTYNCVFNKKCNEIEIKQTK